MSRKKAMAISMAVIMALSLFSLLPIVTAQGTVVSIEDVTVSATGESKVVPIMIEDVTVPAGVGASTITLEYDTGVVIVSDVADGDFDTIVSSIDNVTGITNISTFQISSAGLTGDVVVAYVNLTAVGGLGGTSVLDLTVVSLYEPDGITTIPHTVSDGTFTITLAPAAVPLLGLPAIIALAGILGILAITLIIRKKTK